MSIRQMASHLSARLVNRRNAPLREYASYEDALRDSDSYEDPRLVNLVVDKTRNYRETLQRQDVISISTRQAIQNLFVFSVVKSEQPLNVLEVGGACGATYSELRRTLPGAFGAWSVVETPYMVEAAKALTSEPGLSFHSDLTSAVTELARKDVLMAQGVLQYSDDPLQLLARCFELEFSYVYITRTVATESSADRKPIYTRQETHLSDHGPGPAPQGFNDAPSTQPMTILDVSSFKSAFPDDYELLFWFDEDADRDLKIGDRTVPVKDIGFLARRRIKPN